MVGFAAISLIMKLHLPRLLAAAVLAAVLAAPSFAEVTIPSGYGEPHNIATPDDLATITRDNWANKSAYYITEDISCERWTTSNGFVHETQGLFFTSTPDADPVSLNFFKGATHAVGFIAGDVTFDTFSQLSFSHIAEDVYKAEIYITNIDRTQMTGGAITANHTLTITNVTDGNADTNDVIFQYNASGTCGGIRAGAVVLSKNGNIQFYGNETTGYNSNYSEYGAGAAICATTSSVTLSDNIGNIVFQNNTAAKRQGGAIYAKQNVTISGTAGNILFEGNSSNGLGGAIYAADGNISLEDNLGTISIISNSGSAVSSANGNVLLQGNAGLITFDNNSSSFTGGAISTANGTVSLIGNTGGILFEDNNARDAGCAIFAGKGVNIEGNSSVTFRNHTLTNENASTPRGGGAIYNKAENVTISGNGSVLFDTNKSQFAGGAIYAAGITQTNEDGSTTIQGGNVVMEGNGSVAFNTNTVVLNHQGGAIYADGSVTISGTKAMAGSVSFTNNTAGGNGGAIYAKNGNIVMDGNSSVLFDKNVSQSGGAIFAESGNVSLTGNTTSISFNKNETLTGGGAAIYAAAGTVELTDNGSVSFTYNTSASHGAAISTLSNDISMTGNASLTFDNNKATDGHGGAVYSSKNISINGNGDVTFSNNTAAFATVGTNGKDETFGGGAIFAANSLSLDGNGSITFSGNTSTAVVNASANAEIVRTGGGAINAYGVSIRNTQGDIEFTGNKAAMSGGAIFNRCLGFRAETNMHISGNQGNILFSGNEAGRNGGAIDLGYQGSIALSGNKGSITFNDNKAANFGGAIYGDFTNGVHIENNGGEITFRNNIAGAGAGAIYIHNAPSNLEATQYPSLALHIRNNGNVLFEKNAIKNSDGSYLLRSIAFGNSSTVMDETPIARLSAAAGNKIEFRDSINGHFHLYLNDDYEGTPQTGDIIFTGAFTEKHLKELAGREVTAEEIQASRTSSAYGFVTVGGGRLRLEDGVVLETNTIALKENTGATLLVKDATVKGTSIDKKQGESTIIVNSGTTLQVEGPSDMDYRTQLMFTLADAQVGASALNTTVGAILDVDRLTLNGGSALVMDKTSIDLAGGCLTLLTQGEEKINLMLTLDGMLMDDSSVVLFSGVDTLDLGADMQYTGTDLFEFKANQFFTGSMIGKDTMVQFQNGMVSMTGLATPVVPEPTTATLSLLALAALAARRRRK